MGWRHKVAIIISFLSSNEWENSMKCSVQQTAALEVGNI